MYNSSKATSGCISPSNLKSTLSFFKILTASLNLLVLSVAGSPKVEWDKKATLGSKPNSLTTLAADFAISANWFESGYSITEVSHIKIVFPLFTIRFKPNIISPALGSTTLVIFSSEDEYLRVFPVTIASASLHAIIQDAQMTLSFLTRRSQSCSSIPFCL